MTDPFCMACAAKLFGPEAMAVLEENVRNAPPISPEVRLKIRALFQSAPPRPPVEKTCGH
jgi:hypothetical protein